MPSSPSFRTGTFLFEVLELGVPAALLSHEKIGVKTKPNTLKIEYWKGKKSTCLSELWKFLPS